MDQFIKVAIAAALWTVVFIAAGCAEITPYDPPDYREAPPGNGLLTGAEGEFVFYRKVDEPETGSESGKGSNETEDGEQ